PTIPFWFGEAPARTDELSHAVSALRAAVDAKLTHIDTDSLHHAVEWAMATYRLPLAAAEQLIEYLAAAKGVLGVIPTQRTVVLERFFDESGGMQLVIHAPFGSRINRAWGLSLRKRFCRQFNFELQAAATEDSIVLSLGETHSFALDEVARYLHSNSVRDVLVQALLDAPLFTTRWRWNATIALAIKRARGGAKRPAAFRRMDAEDLIAVVFPDQIACAENLRGEREVPSHPLVDQTIADCLHEAMDVDGLIRVLRALERGDIKVLARDLPHPSPLAQEILNAKPYAFLDDAPLEERRTQAVSSRRWLDPTSAADLGRLDPQAIAQVAAEAWPTAENADELHDALLSLAFVTEAEGDANRWRPFLDRLLRDGRATRVIAAEPLWVAAENLPMFRALLPDAVVEPPVTVPDEFAARAWNADTALVEIARARLQGLGPVTGARLAQPLGVTATAMDMALAALEQEGFVLRGKFNANAADSEWCERRLLARIHRYTIKTLRAEIEPVTALDFMRFLFAWHGLTTEPRPEGPQALATVIDQLEGYEAAAAAWESDLLPVRLHDYDPAWLDSLCLSGRAFWARLTPPKSNGEPARGGGPVRATPIAFLLRAHRATWQALRPLDTAPPLSAHAGAIAAYLRTHGASFFDEMAAGAGLLRSQAEAALGELVAAGLVHADSFTGLRALLLPADRRRAHNYRRRRAPVFGLEDAGRWTLLPVSAKEITSPAPTRERQTSHAAKATHTEETTEAIARLLLARYGVVFRRLLEREPALLPPWYQLLRAYRRLEARGEIRGGRFVGGVAGEQYALPDAVGLLRETRRRARTGTLVALSAVDPLNLVGIITPGARVPALAGNRVLYRDGEPIAVQTAGEVRFLTTLTPSDEWAARTTLQRSPLHDTRSLRVRDERDAPVQ
ncbi:MAG: ATP-dependent DNA helicase, partial [Gammaproteobacteria bacterium]